MNNLVILFFMIAIPSYILQNVFKFFSFRGIRRSLFVLQISTIFVIHGMVLMPLISWYNLKHPDKQIFNLMQTYVSVAPIKSMVESADKKIEHITNPLIPKSIKKTLQPLQHQAADAINDTLPFVRVKKAEGGIMHKVGSLFNGITNTVKGLIGVVI